MAKNFQDITNKAYVALAAGYGIEGAFPIDLRTVLPGTTMLEALIHNNMVYEGMLVYIAGTIYICKPKFHSAVWNPDGDIAVSKGKYYLDEELTQPITDGTASGTTVYSNMLWYEEYQVTSQQVEKATEASKLDHNVVINGKTTNFALNAGEDVTTIDTGLFTPETIEAGTNIDTITHCGFYSYTDADSANNYSLLIEKIGNKLYRTKITIENGVPVVSTSVQTGTQGDSVVWGEWTRLGIGKCITTCTSQSLHTSSVGGNHVALDIKIGSTPELWVYSDSTATYPQGYANIHTADGQVFTIAAQSPAIPHPFVVKLKTANDGTRTAAVESLAATNDKYGTVRFGDDAMKGTSAQRGFVKLSDAINDNTLGENNGVAATPKAVYTLNVAIGEEATARANADSTHAAVKGNASTFGHVELSDATNSDSAASANIAATPKAVKDAVAAEATERANADTTLQNNIDTKAPINHASTATTYGVGNEDSYGHVKLSDSTGSDKGRNDGTAATPAAVNTINERLLTHAAIKGGSDFGHVKVSANHGLSINDGVISMGTANDTTQGTIKLSNAISNSTGVNSGYAATPKAVYTALLIAVAGFMGLFKSKKFYYGECSGSHIETGGSTSLLTIDWLFGGTPSTLNDKDLVILKFTNTSTLQLNGKFIKTSNGNTFMMSPGSTVWNPQNGEIWSFIYKSGSGIKYINGESLIQ